VPLPLRDTAVALMLQKKPLSHFNSGHSKPMSAQLQAINNENDDHDNDEQNDGHDDTHTPHHRERHQCKPLPPAGGLVRYTGNID